MDPFNAFDFASMPRFDEDLGDFSGRASANETTISADITNPESGSDLQYTSPQSDETIQQIQWDQASNEALSLLFNDRNFFDDPTISPSLLTSQFSWEDNLRTTTPKTTTLPNSIHTAQNGITTWLPSEDIPSTKRANDGVDMKAACWTSPLCPGNKDGSSSGPSSCDGDCAPYLFDSTAPEWPKELFKIEETEEEPQEQELHSPEGRSSREAQDTRRSEPPPPATDKKRKHATKKSTSEPAVDKSISPKPAKSSTRQPHNEIERKYRESINGHMEALKSVIPSFNTEILRCSKTSDIEDLTSTPKPSKSAILAGAVTHIKRQKRDMTRLEQENALLRQQIRTLQALVKCEDCSLMQYAVQLSLGVAPRDQMCQSS